MTLEDRGAIFCPLCERIITEKECVEACAFADDEYKGNILEELKKIENFKDKCRACKNHIY